MFLLVEARPDLSVEVQSENEHLDDVDCGNTTVCPHVEIGDLGKPGIVFDGNSTLATLHLPSASWVMPMDAWKGFTFVIKATFVTNNLFSSSTLAISENGALELRQQGPSLHVTLRDTAGTVLAANASSYLMEGEQDPWTIMCAP